MKEEHEIELFKNSQKFREMKEQMDLDLEKSRKIGQSQI